MSTSPVDVTSSSRLSPVVIRTKPCEIRLTSSGTEVTRKMTSHDVRRLTSSPVTDGVTSPPHRPSPVRCCDTGRPLYMDPLTGHTICSCQYPSQHGLPTSQGYPPHGDKNPIPGSMPPTENRTSASPVVNSTSGGVYNSTSNSPGSSPHSRIPHNLTMPGGLPLSGSIPGSIGNPLGGPLGAPMSAGHLGGSMAGGLGGLPVGYPLPLGGYGQEAALATMAAMYFPNAYANSDPSKEAYYPPTMGAYHPYHDFAGYPFNGYGMDLNGARRKNATRETTSTLKAWLNEHKKNPYPTKGEKIMLAIITKMTLTQVSTWFANARRRLKKENKMTWEPRNRVDDDDDDERNDERNDETNDDNMRSDDRLDDRGQPDDKRDCKDSKDSGTASSDDEDQMNNHHRNPSHFINHHPLHHPSHQLHHPNHQLPAPPPTSASGNHPGLIPGSQNSHLLGGNLINSSFQLFQNQLLINNSLLLNQENERLSSSNNKDTDSQNELKSDTKLELSTKNMSSGNKSKIWSLADMANNSNDQNQEYAKKILHQRLAQYTNAYHNNRDNFGFLEAYSRNINHGGHGSSASESQNEGIARQQQISPNCSSNDSCKQ